MSNAPSRVASGLRARKKAATRRALQEHALRLFLADGYDATTVDAIAQAANVSPMTFYRYFPTKEDVVLADDYDPMLGSLIAARPADEPAIESLRHALRAGFGQLLGARYRRPACAHTPDSRNTRAARPALGANTPRPSSCSPTPSLPATAATQRIWPPRSSRRPVWLP